MKAIAIKNNQPIPFDTIPTLEYSQFLEFNTSLLQDENHHCVNYYGIAIQDKVKLICCIANDKDALFHVSSSLVPRQTPIESFTQHHLAFEKFEREIYENFGVPIRNHPWLKPVRFAFNQTNKNNTIANYPFFNIESEELHQVGVGPIHAGIIEPGHFRFICNGEQILHLEIQLGYQHRGIETLFLQKKKLIERHTLAENISGDSVVGHTTTFANLWEVLCNVKTDVESHFARTLALELERIAIHTGDLSGMCTDVGYQLGSAVYGRLRTPIINFFQQWCGNRMAKSLIRAGFSNFPITEELGEKLKKVLDAFEPDFDEICKETFSAPTVLGRFEKTGIVTNAVGKSIGLVGMAARMTNINRDIRTSHPYNLYPNLSHQPILKHHGDAYSRARIKYREVKQSIAYIKTLLNAIPAENTNKIVLPKPTPNTFVLSMVEGWRGEICHCAITDAQGELVHYKIKDPSFHNWLAMALAVRNNEISDFPISNKSFNLSYAGHDL
ncbi:MAG: NADH dehydrogenase subunit [Bacteroidetes bacterium HGW-Bacteroidetes-2]|jgi:Ni,Fe-hydrogenase III large subunit|nr:MAG: NADH dehydrogenase subunit [Bacteroidetes bacterium HGW-Bacteroidetes-2]